MLWLTLRKLKSTDVLERRLTAEKLGSSGDARVVEPLIQILKDDDWGVRKAGAGALGKIKDTRAVKPLLTMLKDRDSSVAEAAVKALAEIKDPSAIDPLLNAFTDAPFSVLLEIRDALAKLDPHWKTSRSARATIQALADDLKDPEGAVRMAAVKALSLIADSRAVDALITALADPDPYVRPWAASGLGQARDARAVGPLVKVLKDQSIRGEAVRALQEIGDPGATEALIEILGEWNQAVDVLGEIGDARAVGPLVRHFLKPKTAVAYRNNPNAPQIESADASRPIQALRKILERHAQNAVLEDLQQVVALQNRVYNLRVDYDTPAYGDGADDYVVEIDVSPVRELAQRELRRREAKR